MATRIHISYLRQADVPNAPEVRKVRLHADRYLKIKRVVGEQTQLTDYDFRNAPVMGSRGTPNGYADSVYRYMIDGNDLHLWIACVVPTDTDLPVPDYQVSENTGAATLFTATGEDGRSETATEIPSWIPVALTEAEKKQRFIEAIKAWREQVKQWLLEAPQYGHLVVDIVTHLGYWLRSADYVIHQLATEAEATRLDWLLLEAIVKEATKGPSTLDPDGDGAYNAEFFLNFRAAVTSFPTGPSFGALWVNWWEITSSSSVSDVSRVANMVNDVLNPAYISTRTKSGLSSSYNPTTEYWTSG